MIDRVKLAAGAKIQLATLKRRIGLEHNNALCRHALCMSLANPSVPPLESLSFSGGIEIDWRTFTGGYEALYYNMLVVRLTSEKRKITEEALQDTLTQHVHRGLSYLVSRREDDLLVELSSALANKV